MLVPNPSYPIHIYGAIIAGADIRSVRMTPGSTSSPSSSARSASSCPSRRCWSSASLESDGAMCRSRFFEKIIALARQHDILVVHDLAYADIVFDGYQAPSIMQVPGAREVAVEFFTMSKSYNMAGWRIGFMVGNRDLVSALARIKSYHDYGSFTPIQVASIVALEGPQECVEEIRKTYQKTRRDGEGPARHRLEVEVPKASMYIWAKIPESYAALGSIGFTKRLLERAYRGRAGHRLRRLRRRPRAHRADRERAPPAPGGARRARHVQKGRITSGRGVIHPRPATLEGHGVRLEPLSREHAAGLAEAAKDGRLWELFFTSVPEVAKVQATSPARWPDRKKAICCPGRCAT